MTAIGTARTVGDTGSLTFDVKWPVWDESLTISQVRRVLLSDFVDRAACAGFVLTGPERWGIIDPGWIMAWAPVERVV